MRDDERFQLRDDGAVPAECELGVEPLLERAQPQFLETGDLGLGEVVVGEVGEGLAAPELECLPDRGLRAGRISAGEPFSSLLQQRSEAIAVELTRLDDQEVAVPARLQALPLAERPTHARDLRLDALDGAGRRLVRPERLDEAVDRDDLVRMEQEHRNEEALLAAAEVDDCAVVTVHLERAEYPEFHWVFRSGGDRNTVSRRLARDAD